MTVRERVKFVRSFRAFRRMLGQRFLMVAQEAGLFVTCNALVLKSSASSAHYRQILGGTGSALSEPVVPQHVWISSVKLLEFLQTA